MRTTALLTAVICLLLTATKAYSQTPTDSATIARLLRDVEGFKRLKFNGYVQAQFQLADSAGVRSVEGGDFTPGMDSRFMVRRSRLKVQYNFKTMEAVFQVDATERSVGMRDAYVKIGEPWLNAFSVTLGSFNRPFGFEVPFSSAHRESPERARWSQTIFPGERDLGVLAGFQLPDASPLSILKLEAGFLNGPGLAPEIDRYKDFIANVSIGKSNNAKTFRFNVGGAYYNGALAQGTPYVYHLNRDSMRFERDSVADVFRRVPREYIGGNAQTTVTWLAGSTTLRAELIQGNGSGTASSMVNPTALPTITTAAPLAGFYRRAFTGGNVYFVHEFLRRASGSAPRVPLLQLVVKYDWFDPNTHVSGADIGAAGSNLTAADIRYNTVGFGGSYFFNANTKLMIYYSMPENEATLLPGLTRNLPDNVLTIRTQLRF